MPGGGWNGGDWSPNLPNGPSGYNGPDTIPPFREWRHLSVDEQLQRAKDWRAQHSRSFQPPGSFSASASASALTSTSDRSSSPRAPRPRAPQPPATRTAPLATSPEFPTAHPYLDNQRGAQRGLRFGGHRPSGQSSATQQHGNAQAFNRQAAANQHPGVYAVPTLGPRFDPAPVPRTDNVPPVAEHPVSVLERQDVFARESSFDDDYQRWESEVVYGAAPVPTSHILVPRLPAPGRSTTPVYVSSPPAPTRNDPQSIASHSIVSRSAPSIPLDAAERLSIQSSPERAPLEIRSSSTAHPAPLTPQTSGVEDQPSSLGTPDPPVAVPGVTETGLAIGSNSAHPEVAGQPPGSTTGLGVPSDDPAVQLTIRDVENRIEELEFQPLTAPFKEPSPPPPDDTETVSRKTAKNRAKKAKQRERNKAKKAAAAAEAEESTFSDTMKDDGKRKATEDPASPAAAKRVKHDDSADPPPSKPKMAVIPFPEKVRPECGLDFSMLESMLTLFSARPTRGACW